MGTDTSRVVDLARLDDVHRTDVRAAAMAEVVDLARALAIAETSGGVVEIALRFCAERIGVPVAAWQHDPDGAVRRLVGVWGAGRRGVARVTAALPILPAEGFAGHEDPPEREAFRAAFELSRVRIVPAGEVTILAGDPPLGFGPVLDAIGDLVGRSLAKLDDRDARTPVGDDLDLGLAMTAHELRGPLVGARAALEQAIPAGDEATPAHRLLRRTASELDGLSRRLDGMLRWSAGAERTPLQACDLVAVVEAAVGSATLGRRDGRVVLSAPTSLPVRAAPAHLRLALENLLRNALTYSDETTKVEVEVACVAGRPTIEVRDEGPGVPPAERPHLFRAFVRGHSGRGRSGDGLGLFIAKRVVDAHRGDLEHEPNPSGRGSVFRIRLAPVDGDG